MSLYKLNLKRLTEFGDNNPGTLGGVLIISGTTESANVAGATINGNPAPNTGNTLLGNNSCLVAIGDADGVAIWSSTSGNSYNTNLTAYRPGFDRKSGITAPTFEETSFMYMSDNQKIGTVRDLSIIQSSLLLQQRLEMNYAPYYSSTDNYLSSYFNFKQVPQENQCPKLSVVGLKPNPMFLNTYHLPTSVSTTLDLITVNDDVKSQLFASGNTIVYEYAPTFTTSVPNDGRKTAARFITSGSTVEEGADPLISFNSVSGLITTRVLYQREVPGGCFGFCGDLQYVELGKDVTSIGTWAFIACSSLTRVDCNTINELGNAVFGECHNLETFNFGENSTLTELPYSTFNGCYRLNNITLPNTLRTIGEHAFEDCSGLTSIVIPASCTVISSDAFKNCINLTSVTFEDITTLKEIHSQAFCGCSKLKIFGGGVEGTDEYNLFPTNVEILGTQAFSGCTLLECDVIISEQLVSAGTEVFLFCKSLTSVEYNSPIMGEGMFKGTHKLENIKFGPNVKTIAKEAFSNARKVKYLYLNNVETVGYYAFGYLQEMEELVFGPNIKTISGISFCHCDCLTNIVFEGKTPPTTIASNAFSGSTAPYVLPESGHVFYMFDTCSGITSFSPRFPASWDFNQMTEIKGDEGTIKFSLSDSSFTGTNEKWLGAFTINGVNPLPVEGDKTATGFTNDNSELRFFLPLYKDVPDRAFSGTTSHIRSVILPSQVTSIGIGAFKSGSTINNIDIKATAITIDAGCFDACYNLRSLKLPAFSAVTTVSTSCFNGCSKLKYINYVGSTAPSIKNKTFEGIASYGTLSHPNTNSIGNMLSTSAYYLGYYHWINENDIDWDTFLYSAATNSVTKLCNASYISGLPGTGGGPGASGDTSGGTTTAQMYVDGTLYPAASSYTFTETMTDNLHVVKYPSGYVNAGSFSGTTALYKVILSTNTVAIGTSAFKGCTNLDSVTASNLTSLGSGSFSGCTKLTTASLGGTFTQVQETAFFGCTSLENITLPTTVTLIGESGFTRCSSLTEIDTSRITSLGNGAFSGCSSLENIVLGNVTTSPVRTFQRCTSLKSVKFGSGSTFTTLGQYYFEGCTSLTDVELPNSVTLLNHYSFRGCSALSSITLPQNLSAIGNNVFSGATSLEEIFCLTSACTIGNNTTFFKVKEFGTIYFYHWSGTLINNFINGTTQYYLGYYHWNYKQTQKIELDFNIPNGDTGLKQVNGHLATHIISGNTFYKGTETFNFPTAGNHHLTLLINKAIPQYYLNYNPYVTSIVYDVDTPYPGNFSFCDNLITFSSTTRTTRLVDGVYDNTFAFCPSLTGVSMYLCPLNFKSTFYNDNSLSSFTFDSVASSITIGNYAFCNCTTLEDYPFNNISFEDAKIGHDAFRNSGIIGSIILSGITEIGSWAFEDTQISTVQSKTLLLTNSGMEMFKNCKELNYVWFQDCTFETVPFGMFSFCDNSFFSVFLPSTVKKIEPSAFFASYNLTITIGNNTSNVFSNIEIGGSAFYSVKFNSGIKFHSSSTNSTDATIIRRGAFQSRITGEWSTKNVITFSGFTSNITCDEQSFQGERISGVTISPAASETALPVITDSTFGDVAPGTTLTLPSRMQSALEASPEWLSYPWTIVYT